MTTGVQDACLFAYSGECFLIPANSLIILLQRMPFSIAVLSSMNSSLEKGCFTLQCFITTKNRIELFRML